MNCQFLIVRLVLVHLLLTSSLALSQEPVPVPPQEPNPEVPVPVPVQDEAAVSVPAREELVPMVDERVREPEILETHRRLVLNQRLIPSSGPIQKIQFSANGEYLALAQSGVVRIWDVSNSDVTKHTPHEFKVDSNESVTAFAFSADGRLVAASGANGRIWLWDLATGDRIENGVDSEDVGSPVKHLAFQDEKLAAVSSADKIRVFQVSEAREGTTAPVFNLSGIKGISVNGRYVLRTDANSRLKIWDIVDERILPLDIPVCEHDTFAITADGTTLFLSGVDLAKDDIEPGEDDPWETKKGAIWAFVNGIKQRIRDADDQTIHTLHASPDEYGGHFFFELSSGKINVRCLRSVYGGEKNIYKNLQLPGGDDFESGAAYCELWPPRIARPKKDGSIEVAIWWVETYQVPRFDRVEAAMRRESNFVSAPDRVGMEEDADPFVTYTVYYGTNRKGPQSQLDWLDVFKRFLTRDVGIILLVVSALAFIAVLLVLAVRRSLTLGTAIVSFLIFAFLVCAVPAAQTWRVVSRDPNNPKEYFGSERDKLTYGSCEVTIPNGKEHTPGALEGPIWFLKADPAKHIILNKIEGTEARLFMERINREAKGKAAFVFIHGYNVSFEGAARRTAQMAYDLKFDGAPIFFSWPSQAQLVGYVQDANNSDLAGAHLAQLLSDVERFSEANTIYLIAHSMGTKVLSNALRDMGRERWKTKDSKFKEIILAAPDIDADYFRKSIAPAIAAGSDDNHRVTLYASTQDKALQLSQQINGYPRAGDAAQLVVYPGIDTIDVSNIGDQSDPTGHSYYGGLPDLMKLLSYKRVPPEERIETLEPRFNRELPYWVHKPLEEE